MDQEEDQVPPVPPRRNINLSPTDAAGGKMTGCDTASLDWCHPRTDDWDITTNDIEPAISPQQELKSLKNRGQLQTPAQAQIEKELKVEDGLPFGRTNKERLTKLFYTSLWIFLALFLANAFVISIAFWRLSCLGPEDLLIRRVEVQDLDQPIARLSVQAELPKRWYYFLFNVVLQEPTIFRLYVPEAVRKAEDKWTPIIVAKLPRIHIGRGGRTFNWSKVPVEISHQIPLQDLFDYFNPITASVKGAEPKRLEVRVNVEIQTASYWVPIAFSHSLHQTVELPPRDPSKPPEMPQLKVVEFVDEHDPNVFAVLLHIRYPKLFIPHFFFLHIPPLSIDVAHFVDNKQEAMSKNACIEVMH